jgi:hypothetical protein
MIKKLLLPLFVGSLALFVASCDSDPCADKICGTGGACFEGDCVCDAGYQRDADGACNVETRTFLAGTYKTTEQCSCDNTPTPYDLTVTAGSDILSVNLFNFFNSFQSTPVIATIGDGGTLTIASQKPAGASGTVTVAGTGTFATDAAGKTTLTITYTVTDTDPSAGTCTCTSTVFTKQ